MQLDLTINNIYNLTKGCDEHMKKYLSHQGFIDYNQGFGREHYKLFISISKQLKDAKILEIGTHNGNSAVALSYGNIDNNNITIDTYDIVDLLEPNPKQFFGDYNVNYNLKNILTQDYLNEHKDELLSYDIIFMDIDPHEGILEYQLYQWLKQNKYEGIIIFDDIQLGLNHIANNYRPTKYSMADFWNKVEEEDKLDLTHLGHWSGTGVVCFDFDKNNISL
jgi:predicted O-methyltransferase YrrM